MINVSIGDGKAVEVKEFVRNPNKVVYADAKALAREHLNIPVPEQSEELEKLTLLLVSVMEGERVYLTQTLLNNSRRALESALSNLNA